MSRVDRGARRGGQGYGFIHQMAVSGALPPVTQRDTADLSWGGYTGCPRAGRRGPGAPREWGGRFPTGGQRGPRCKRAFTATQERPCWRGWGAGLATGTPS